MKKLIFLLSLISPFWVLAQSATILPNNIGVPKVSALPACSTNGRGNQVFNTINNKMYYCNGTNWQEMTGGGFTLPYYDSLNTNTTLFALENKNAGSVIYAKAKNGPGIRTESETNYGIYSLSNSYYGVYAESITGTAVYGKSTDSYGGYFKAQGVNPALYAYNDNGEAAILSGDVRIIKELVVDGNKGIVRNNSGTQLKVIRPTVSYSANNLPAGGYIDGGYNYEDFGGTPTVTVGQIQNITSVGEWYKVLIIPMNVTATQCTFRMVNVSNSPITFTGYWSLLIVGPE